MFVSLVLLIACSENIEKDTGPTTTDTAAESDSGTDLSPSAEPSIEPSSEPSMEPATEPSSEPSTEPGDTGENNQNDCPSDVTCVTSFPFVHVENTARSAQDSFDNYSCAPNTNESGPENLYRITLPTDGFLGLELTESGMATGVDVDVHLLGSRNNNDCIDRGHWTAGSLLTAGEYWVVVDSWTSNGGNEMSGEYELEIGFTSFTDFESMGMESTFAEDALFAFDTAWKNGDTDRLEYAVTDFSEHSSIERMWIWDLSLGQMLGNLHVAHGEASSSAWNVGVADTFSNVSGSHQSSLGMMRGAESYYGSYDYSMRMDGLEPYNSLVRPRAIVVHGWTGSRPEYVSTYGATAPTWGCPGVDDREIQWVVDTLKDGALLFFWYPDGDWSVYSEYLQ